MNLYLMVEGRTTEKKVYRSWVEIAFPTLTRAERLDDIWDNSYRLFTIDGNTDRVDNIERSLREIEWHNSRAQNEGRRAFDSLFVCLDAEDSPIELKIEQIVKLTTGRANPTVCYPVIHNCCIETWFLGNRPMMRRQNIESDQLRQWKTFYDVSEQCPEFMEKPTNYAHTKARFHHDYLKEMLRERGLRYSKQIPGPVQEKEYLQALIDRYETTSHIQSFGKLLALWRSLGGQI